MGANEFSFVYTYTYRTDLVHVDDDHRARTGLPNVVWDVIVVLERPKLIHLA